MPWPAASPVSPCCSPAAVAARNRRPRAVGGPAAAAESGTLTVLAAASLTETFNALEKQFETDHPGVDVKLNYAGSSDLPSRSSTAPRPTSSPPPATRP